MTCCTIVRTKFTIFAIINFCRVPIPLSLIAKKGKRPENIYHTSIMPIRIHTAKTDKLIIKKEFLKRPPNTIQLYNPYKHKTHPVR